MNGSEERFFVLDTNIVLYFLGGRLASRLPSGHYSISIISEIELLSYSRLSSTEEAQIRDFIAQISVIGIERDVKNLAIELRKQYRLRLPDAIITATAKSLNATLFTNDAELTNIAEISIQSLPLL